MIGIECFSKQDKTSRNDYISILCVFEVKQGFPLSLLAIAHATLSQSFWQESLASWVEYICKINYYNTQQQNCG